MEPRMEDQRVLALWAADCAERVLSYLESEHPTDGRPGKAIEGARAWARGELRVCEARSAALAAHAAARGVEDAAARAAARAAGYAAATAHVADHARAAAAYAVRVVGCAAGEAKAAEKERKWQVRRLPEQLRPVVFPDQQT